MREATLNRAARVVVVAAVISVVALMTVSGQAIGQDEAKSLDEELRVSRTLVMEILDHATSAQSVSQTTR